MVGAVRFMLWLLLLVGLYGALSVSYTTLSGGTPCPELSGIRVCYLVTLAYSMMIASMLVRHPVGSLGLFVAGWLIAFGFAALGSFFQVTRGDTCPVSSSGLPLCYASLFL